MNIIITYIKRRLLELLGYNLVSVPYWEWDEVRQDKRAQKAYLRNNMSIATARREGEKCCVNHASCYLTRLLGIPLLCFCVGTVRASTNISEYASQ